MSGADLIPLVIECGFRASFPLSAALAVTRLTFRSSAATRHFVWGCAIAIAVLLPLSEILTPRWSVTAPAPLARLASAARLEAAPSTIPGIGTAEQIRPGPIQRPKDRWSAGFMPWRVAAWIWGAGAVVVSCYVLMGYFAAWRLYRTTQKVEDSRLQDAEQLASEAGLSRALCFVESPAVSAPAVLHLWQPIIVMPETAGRWSRARVRAVLLHEFAHIKRNDVYMQSLAQFAASVYWFNPLIWLAAYKLRLEGERACDDFVLLGGTSGADYATHLFAIAREGSASTAGHFAIGFAEHRSQLEQRLVAIVNPRTPRQSTTILGKFIVALPMLLAALATGAVQVTARATPVPAESSAERNSQPEDFRWASRMHEHQTIEVYLGRGSMQILPSTDDTVRVQGRTDDPEHSEIQAVSTSSGVKFCNIVTVAHQSHNYCGTGQDTSRIQDDHPQTELLIYVPAGLHFTGNTILGDITIKRPSADSDMATIDGKITLELAPEEGANFKGNVIKGEIDSDFPLNDNTPPLPHGERQAMKAPRIVHTIVGSGGPHLSAMVVRGDIRLLRRSTE